MPELARPANSMNSCEPSLPGELIRISFSNTVGLNVLKSLSRIVSVAVSRSKFSPAPLSVIVSVSLASSAPSSLIGTVIVSNNWPFAKLMLPFAAAPRSASEPVPGVIA